jgi:glutaconate CoA-transferase subunit B
MAAVTTTELLAIRLARHMTDEHLGFLGVASGLHRTAFLLAQRTTCPNLAFVERGGRYVCGRTTITGSRRDDGDQGPEITRDLDGMVDLIDWRAGVFDVAFLGGLQIDGYGNVNTIAIGPYESPSLRGPGSIGAGALAALVSEIHLVTEEHSARILVEEVDNCSGVGHFLRGRDRRAFHLKTEGPAALHTPLATFVFEGHPARAHLSEVVGAVSIGDLQKITGFPIVESSTGVRPVSPPTDQEVTALRSLSAVPGKGT